MPGLHVVLTVRIRVRVQSWIMAEVAFLSLECASELRLSGADMLSMACFSPLAGGWHWQGKGSINGASSGFRRYSRTTFGLAAASSAMW